MKIKIPEERESLISIGEATDDDRNIFPWAIELEDEWNWGVSICDLDQAIYYEDMTGKIVPKPEGIAGTIADTPFYLVMARSADAVLQYVLENPHYYGLMPVEDTLSEKPQQLATTNDRSAYWQSLIDSVRWDGERSPEKEIEERNKRIALNHFSGMSYAKIAKKYGLSRELVRSICQKIKRERAKELGRNPLQNVLSYRAFNIVSENLGHNWTIEQLREFGLSPFKGYPGVGEKTFQELATITLEGLKRDEGKE